MTLSKFYITILISILSLNCQFIQSFSDKSGVQYKIKVTAKDKNNKDIAKQAAMILENRVGYSVTGNNTKASIDPTNPDVVIVKVFGKHDTNSFKKLLLFEADLQLMKVNSPPNPNLATYPSKEDAEKKIAKSENSKFKIFEYTERTSFQDDFAKNWIIVENTPIITGNDLRQASAVPNINNEIDYQIAFSLKPDGAKTFGEWTGKNIGNYMAVILNDKAISVAFIQSQIFDQGQINGQFTKEQAQDLALSLNSGYLPAKLTLIEEKAFDGKSE